jgi:hypothetical protein
MAFSTEPVELARQLLQYPHKFGWLCGKEKLTQMHSDWIKYVWGKGDRTLQAHRGAYKSTACVEVGMLWWLLFHPNDRIALVRETAIEAWSALAAIKRIIQLDSIKFIFKALHQDEPKLVIGTKRRLTFNFKKTVTKEGSIDAYGIDTVPTGSHYDVILCDDIVTIKSRLSKAQRDLVKANLMEIVTNIIDPGKKVVHIGTPWHEQDAWTLQGDGKPVMPKPLKFDVFSTGILTEEQIAEKKSRSTNSLWAANYELKHVSDADLPFAGIGFSHFSPDFEKVYAHLDAKFSGDHFNALTLVYQDRNTKKITVKGFTSQKHIEAWLPTVCSILTKYKVNELFVEDNADKGFVANLFRESMPGLWTECYHEKENKENKIMIWITFHFKNLVFDYNCDEDYLMQVRDYRPGNEPDDAPDSLASCLRAVYPQNTSLGLYRN